VVLRPGASAINLGGLWVALTRLFGATTIVPYATILGVAAVLAPAATLVPAGVILGRRPWRACPVQPMALV
jgi:hypothetical protein